MSANCRVQARPGPGTGPRPRFGIVQGVAGRVSGGAAGGRARVARADVGNALTSGRPVAGESAWGLPARRGITVGALLVAAVVGIAISTADHEARYLPFGHTGLSETPNLPERDTLERLKPVLEAGRDARLLRFDNSESAFRTFFGLIVRDVQIRLLLGDKFTPTQKGIEADAERATEQFLALYGTKPAPRAR